jgi:hypothetical protein
MFAEDGVQSCATHGTEPHFFLFTDKQLGIGVLEGEDCECFPRKIRCGNIVAARA